MIRLGKLILGGWCMGLFLPQQQHDPNQESNDGEASDPADHWPGYPSKVLRSRCLSRAGRYR